MLEQGKGANEIWTLASSHASVQIWSLGAALHHLRFLTRDGGNFQPLAEAGWLEGAGRPPLTGAAHLRTLGGEWPCVPFGSTSADPEHHGFGANHHWRMVERDEISARLVIDYPSDHAVSRLERHVRLLPDRAAVELSLSIEVRQACRIPIGLHPIFRLPLQDGALAVNIPASGPVRAAPEGVRPGNARLPAGAAVTLDQLHVLEQQELVQIWQSEGVAELSYPEEKQKVLLEWQAEQLPHCLLWIAKPAIFDDHQSECFFGLGVEPVNSYFDSNDLALHVADNSCSELATGVALSPEEVWSVDYSISLT